MDYKITRHLLSGDDVDYVETKGKDSGVFEGELPDTIVIHYTAGASLESSVNTLRDPKVKASAHVVVGRNGEIKQLIPFNKVAWHAGRSEWGTRIGLNKYSIGIEIDNAGLLDKVGDQFHTWWGATMPQDQVYMGVHRNESQTSYWHAFTEKQIDVLFQLCSVIKEKYNIQEILGHEEIAPHRKQDPGPAFPLDKLRQRLLEDRSEEAAEPEVEMPDVSPTPPSDAKIGVVTATSLNFRIQPSLDAEKKSTPLAENTRVEVLEDRAGWLKIKVAQVGWVKKEYIKMLP